MPTRYDLIKSSTDINDIESCCPGDFVEGWPTSDKCKHGFRTEEDCKKCWKEESR
jgi:hypothetical protein